MRVLLVDDHALLLEGLQSLLEAHGIEVIGTAKDGREAAAAARSLKPDVILMDIHMPVCDGLTATRMIKAEMPEVKVVILTTSSEDEELFEAVKSGGGGYLLKSMDAEELIEALYDALHDTPPFAPGLAAKLMAEFARTAQIAAQDCSRSVVVAATDSIPAAAPPGMTSPEEPLTSRQLEVLTLVAAGLSYKEVGARICLSPRTVKYHMAETVRKLHLRNRAQVLTYAGRVASDGEVQQADR